MEGMGCGLLLCSKLNTPEVVLRRRLSRELSIEQP
eukprot:SAG22_NODE_21474_length_256_cov_1.579618_1_plen_34_part_01